MLTKREKGIMVALAVVGAAALLAWRVGKPYFETRDKIAADIQKAQSQLSEMELQAMRRAGREKSWKDMLKASPDGALMTDPSLAQSQAVQMIEKWAASRRVTVEFPNVITLPPTGEFTPIDITLKAKGSDPHVTELIYLIETAKFPLRITNVQITPVKEGLRDVVATINVTTVSYKEPAKKPAAKG